ncbi:MAG: hypothetical protein JXA22_04065 [Candidatus Thermoplasmatota archaeon]|nr:hypothetical protein [Candidatus Thermoplasmatota archaeon]
MSSEVIVTLSDAGYILQAKQLFSSVYHNSGWKGDYLLLAQEIKKDDLTWFMERGIIVRPISKMHTGSFSKHPSTILGKFHLFSPEFKRWKKVIFLDADIIVEASLDGLKEVEGFNAVPDIHFKSLQDQFRGQNKLSGEKEKTAYKDLERMYDIEQPAFNSGVMSFDTKIIANDNMFNLLMDLHSRFGPIANSDQSILNLFFYKTWNRLPLFFNNYFPYRRPTWKPRYIPTDSIIQHFLWDKPWTRDDRYFDRKWRLNLARAKDINLCDRIGPVKVWNEDKKIKQECLLASLNRGNGKIKGSIYACVDLIDVILGKAGLVIKGLHDH